MRLDYFADTDTLYIELSDRASNRSESVSEDVVLDYDTEDKLVGVDIDNATRVIRLDRLVLSQLPSEVEII